MSTGFDQVVKTIMLDPAEGRVQREMSARQILEEPNRHQFEPIIKALSICLLELMKRSEEAEARMYDALVKAKESQSD